MLPRKEKVWKTQDGGHGSLWSHEFLGPRPILSHCLAIGILKAQATCELMSSVQDACIQGLANM